MKRAYIDQLALIIGMIAVLFVLGSVVRATSLLVEPIGKIWYVNNKGGAGSCESWEEACDLQVALTKAKSGDAVWVAQGTYTPTSTEERGVSFVLERGVEIYGGFAGTETALEERDWVANPAILSGNIGKPDVETDNSYHVVFAREVDETAVLDGFTISGGYADGTAGEGDSGGGIYLVQSSPTLTNLIIENNSADMFGGGMFNTTYSSPRLFNVIFAGNTANYDGGGMANDNNCDPNLTEVAFRDNLAVYGGGMHNKHSAPELNQVLFENNRAEGTLLGYGGGMVNEYSNPSLTQVRFSGNVASGDGGGLYNFLSDPRFDCVTFDLNTAQNGGGLFNFASNPTLINITFSANTATSSGGGMYNNASSPRLTNVTFTGNVAPSVAGGGLHNINDSNPELVNVILWGNSHNAVVNEGSNPVITYSIVQGGYAGEGNMGEDPLLDTLADNGGFTPTHALQVDSPAVDAGSPTVCPATDQRGMMRPLDGDANGTAACDMGAYEAHTVIFVDCDALGVDNGTTWANAFVDLQDALAYAVEGNQIWVAEGTYYPTDTTDRLISFSMKTGVGIYGGFAGTETTRDSRDWEVNPTILSGDIGLPDDQSDNSYHVVKSIGVDSSAILDGFFITGGNADGSTEMDQRGGGMYNANNSTPDLKNTTFDSNEALVGGGMFNTSSSPTLTNATFSDNSATHGGGMYNLFSSNPILNDVKFFSNINRDSGAGSGMFNISTSNPSLSNVLFEENDGYVMYNTSVCSPILTNVTFINNFGIGMFNNNANGQPILTNVTFSGNTSTGIHNYQCDTILINVSISGNGSGINNSHSSPSLTNVTIIDNLNYGMLNANESFPTMKNGIVWGNHEQQIQNTHDSSATITYSIIEGGYDGEGNKDEDPKLDDLADNGGFTQTHALQTGSPAIDAGNPDPTTCPETDQRGMVRPLDGDGNGVAVCDMGAYEAEFPVRPIFLPLILR